MLICACRHFWLIHSSETTSYLDIEFCVKYETYASTKQMQAHICQCYHFYIEILNISVTKGRHLIYWMKVRYLTTYCFVSQVPSNSSIFLKYPIFRANFCKLLEKCACRKLCAGTWHVACKQFIHLCSEF